MYREGIGLKGCIGVITEEVQLPWFGCGSLKESLEGFAWHDDVNLILQCFAPLHQSFSLFVAAT